MEDGVKGDPVEPKNAPFLSKAGWVKKASGRFIAAYKDRYIHVEKTEVVVYENEDLKTCLQRFDLENFEKCLELRSVFKRNRLILVREPKSGSKKVKHCVNSMIRMIQNIKFQLQTPEEKDSWIKALSDGINRAKNKIFDEVKVDESNNLDHVTRNRPKGNRGRRPPTRIHMKEVATISSDGILRLDLDVPDAALSNGNHYVNVETMDPPKKAQTPPMPPSSTSDVTEKMQSSSPELEEPQAVVEPTPPKKIFKPPMPPSKDSIAISATENGPSMQAGPEKVPGPPKPPSKELKPSLIPAEDDVKDLSEGDPVVGADEKTDPQTPPTEPTSSSTEDLAIAMLPLQETKPPTVPPKEKKPSKGPDCEGLPLTSEGTSDEIVEKVIEMDPSLSILTLPAVQKPEVVDLSESNSAGEHPEVFEKPTSDSSPSGPAASTTLPSLDSPSLELTRKNPQPPLKKKPPKPLFAVKQDQPTGSTDTTATHHENRSSTKAKFETATIPSVHSTYLEETPRPTTESHKDIPTVVLTLSEPEAVKSDLSEPADGAPAEKTKETSEDRVCHSDGDSVDSGSEDTSSTFALRGSQVGLDSFYASEDDGEEFNNQEQICDAAPPGTKICQVTSSVQVNLILAKPPKLAARPLIPMKPTAKAMSASVGDLLSNASTETEKRQPSRDTSPKDTGDGLKKVKNLEREVALGLEQTKELLSCTSQTQGEGLGKNVPEDLLAKAMEKLRLADHFLREAKNLEELKHSTNRNNRSSW